MTTQTKKIDIATCLWFNKNAEEAAKFYAKTFPDSRVTAVNKSPCDYPNGKAGDALTVEFTVLGQLVQGQIRIELADRAAGINGGDHGP